MIASPAYSWWMPRARSGGRRWRWVSMTTACRWSISRLRWTEPQWGEQTIWCDSDSVAKTGLHYCLLQCPLANFLSFASCCSLGEGSTRIIGSGHHYRHNGCVEPLCLQLSAAGRCAKEPPGGTLCLLVPMWRNWGKKDETASQGFELPSQVVSRPF